MKNIFALLIIAAITFAGCGKNGNNDNDTPKPVQPTPPTPAVLSVALSEVAGSGSKVTLSWSVANGDNITLYQVFRSEDATAPFVEIFRTTDKKITTYFDTDVPFNASVRYQVSASATGAYAKSNIVGYNRTKLDVFDVLPNDILYNKEDNLFYVIERSRLKNNLLYGGTINIYDPAKNKIIKSAQTEATLGFADIGVYNGKKELYVPGDDGKVLVYDAITLDKITQINTDLKNYCVVYHKNNLYISTSRGVWNNPLRVISRANGALVSETGFFPTTRFKHVPNTDFDLLEITSINTSPGDQKYYKFSPDGLVLSRKDDTYHDSRILDDRIFEFFPDGKQYITTSTGIIYNSDMFQVRTLPRGDLRFTSFAFDKAQSEIYAATRTRSIEVYNLSNYEKVKSYTTSAYPFRIFDFDDHIICFSQVASSKPYLDELPSDIIGFTVERINK